MRPIATVKARMLSEYRPPEKAASPLRRKAVAYGGRKGFRHIASEMGFAEGVDSTQSQLKGRSKSGSLAGPSSDKAHRRCSYLALLFITRHCLHMMNALVKDYTKTAISCRAAET